MRRIVHAVLLAAALVGTGCAVQRPANDPSQARGLVGAWEVTSSRTSGVGKNLLTFSSDGTFFRSGDTHPVLSGAHGAWMETAPRVYRASYVAFVFDSAGKWSGVNRNNLEIRVSEDGNSFQGSVKSSNRDLQDNVLRGGTATLEGSRIRVRPFE